MIAEGYMRNGRHVPLEIIFLIVVLSACWAFW